MTTRTWTRLIRVAAAAGLSVALSSPALAAPGFVSYIGQLSDSMGYVDDEVDIEVKLFDQLMGGTEFWAQSWTGVEVMGGLFQLDIGMGASTPLGPVLLDRNDVWIEIRVDGQILSPRQKLSSAGYAQIAKHTRQLGGIDAADYLTEANLAAAPSRAGTTASAPSDPALGELWWNAAEQALYAAKDDGAGGMEWDKVSSGDLEPDNLPPNGLGVVSNGVLGNEFQAVSHLWNTPVAIPDAGAAGPGAPAEAPLDVEEDPASYIYDLTIFINFSLDANSDITVTLFPPAGPGIVLEDAVLASGPHSYILDPSDNPGLDALLFTQPAGTWTLAIVDSDDNLVNSGPNKAGTLNSFELRYDVVRGDHIQAAGLFEADDIVANEIVAETVDASGGAFANAAVNIEGHLIRGITAKTWYNNNWESNGDIPDRNTPFVKRNNGTILMITYHDNFRESTSSAKYWEARINGATCRRANNNLIRHTFTINSGSSNAFNWRPHTLYFFCERAQGIGDGSSIPAGNYTIQIWTETTGYHGYSSTGSLTVEEIWN